jgi:hypothetical protein
MKRIENVSDGDILKTLCEHKILSRVEDLIALACMLFRLYGSGHKAPKTLFLGFGLPKETSVQADNKKSEMNDGAGEAEIGGLHRTRAIERDVESYLPKIELEPAAYEESSGQKFSKFLESDCQIDERQAKKNDCANKIGKHFSP